MRPGSAHSRLVALLDADPALADRPAHELGALVGIMGNTASLYRLRWLAGARLRRWRRIKHANRSQVEPRCSRCTILESPEEPLLDGLCITCWWRKDGGKTYEFVEGKDPERWERLRVALEKVLDEKDVIEYTYK